MSLSRWIARVSKNPEEYAETMFRFAMNILSAGGSKKVFENRLHREFTALHRGGFDKDELRRLRVEARRAFHQARESMAKPAGSVFETGRQV
jgi:hypothetical protein